MKIDIITKEQILKLKQTTMKKNFLLTVCLAVAGVLGVNAQNGVGTVALHHEGKVTLYAGGETQAAMDASVKGDTLYFSEGTFGGFNVTHGIVILGSGQNTVVTSNITIAGNEEKKDLDDYILESLNMLKSFTVADSVKRLKMSQCQMYNFTVWENTFVDEAEICMSYVKGTLSLASEGKTRIYGLNVVNSKINEVYHGGINQGSVTFFNCNIGSCPNIGGKNVFTNCIINGSLSASAYVNCLYRSDMGVYNNPTFYNCWYESNPFLNEDLNTYFTDENLKSNGYIGTDGTVVGITGGVHPYTLELFRPHIAEHQMEVDDVNRTLKVTLKMAGEVTR